MRFELTMPCGMPPFQGGGINHYPTPPTVLVIPERNLCAQGLEILRGYAAALHGCAETYTLLLEALPLYHEFGAQLLFKLLRFTRCEPAEGCEDDVCGEHEAECEDEIRP